MSRGHAAGSAGRPHCAARRLYRGLRTVTAGSRRSGPRATRSATSARAARLIGDPATQRDFLIATSPPFQADRINKPLLVLQGANDPRVLQAESDEIVAQVRANGVPVEYVVPDEGHGFTKKKNRVEGYGKVLAFLDRHLKAAPAETK